LDFKTVYVCLLIRVRNANREGRWLEYGRAGMRQSRGARGFHQTRPCTNSFEEMNMQLTKPILSSVASSARRRLLSFVVLACAALGSWVAIAQVPNAYGPPIGIDAAKRAAALALAEGKKNGWTVAAAIVDPGGTLVYFERIDGTQNGSSDVAIAKARSAAAFKRPTKVFEEAVAAGRNVIMTLPGAMPVEGGLPIVDGGKVVGAIGVSGATSQQDGVCAQAALAAFGGKPATVKK
jgi:glc operon protein GlcG